MENNFFRSTLCFMLVLDCHLTTDEYEHDDLRKETMIGCQKKNDGLTSGTYDFKDYKAYFKTISGNQLH